MITDQEYDRLRDAARDIDDAIAFTLGENLGQRNLWKLGVVVGRLVGEIMLRHNRRGADALAGISIFCDIVVAEAAHTLTIARSGSLQ